MKKLWLVIAIALSLGIAGRAYAQTNVSDAQGHCVELVCPDGRRLPCNGSCSPPTTSSSGLNPVLQGVASSLQNQISDAFANWLSGGNKNSAAAAAEKAAEQRRLEAELARQRALAAERRQRIFSRINSMLAASGVGTLSTPGIQMTDVQSMMGSDKPGIGLDDIKSASDAGFDTPAKGGAEQLPKVEPNVVDLRDCSGPSNPCPTPTGDFGVVDLRSVQQGVDLAVVAAKAPAADQQAILDQALAAANGDKTIQITVPPNAPVPAVSQQAFLGFQMANAAYRKAWDSRYQIQKTFQDAMKKCGAGDAIVYRMEKANFIADLQGHEDEMTLAQQQQGLGLIFQAGLDADVACGDENAQIALAIQNTDWARLQAEGVLAKIAQVSGPTAPTTQPITDSDLKLLLPDQPLAQPSESDMHLVEDTILPKPLAIPAEAVREYPPAVAVKYKTDPIFAQQLQETHAALFGDLQKEYRAAAQEADYAYRKEIVGLTQKGIVKAGVPLDGQESANPQLHVQLQNIRQELRSRVDYECSRARYNAESHWLDWLKRMQVAFTGKPEPPWPTGP